MRLLFITPFFHPHRGGTELYSEGLLTALTANYSQIKADVLCYNTDQAAKIEEYNGMKVYRVSCFQIIPGQFIVPRILSLVRILIKLSRRNYSFVLTQTRVFDTCWWVWLYARLVDAKSVFIGHGADFVHHPNRLVEIVARFIDCLVAPFVLGFYDQVVVISSATKFFYQQYLRVKKPVLIYGGVDSSRLAGRNVGERIIPKIYKCIDVDDVVITFVGRLIWAKGVNLLYDAFKDVSAESATSIKLIFAGVGELEDELKERVRKDGFQDKVFFTGLLDPEEVQDLLAMTDIFVNPSFNEGLPRTVLEAAASGCFVIATDVGSTREIIQDVNTGILLKSNSVDSIKKALLWYFDYQEKAVEMANAAQSYVQKSFDWDVVSREFYREVLSNKFS